MRERLRLHSPALAISAIALFVALGGSVYAATRISGKAIRVKSLPGNRLKPHSLPANRLKPGILNGLRLQTPLTGADINELTLGQVPSAAHAETADSAQSAVDAQTALNAVNAIDAKTVNGHSVGCLTGTTPFAGACWQTSSSGAAVTAPEAAANCAALDGTLPGALELAAFAKRPDIKFDAGDEWSSDIPVVSGADAYAVTTVSAGAVVNRALATETRHYRCVIPLLT
jgi:hypothetical protein